MDIKAFGKVGLIYGGQSSERAVSLKSGQSVANALSLLGIETVLLDGDGYYLAQKIKQDHIQRCLIMQHGGQGEGGALQSMLDAIEIPYTGSSGKGCYLAMDKAISKAIWQQHQIPMPKTHKMKHANDIGDLLFPIAVKPINQGSSIGVTKVKTNDQLYDAYQKAREYGDVIAEQWIEGKEITVSIVNGHILPAIWINPKREFYDYEAKYNKDSGTEYICPSMLDSQTEARIKDIALLAFETLHCSGWGRIDFIVDHQMNPYLFEVNTVPGMTELSLVPQAAKVYGWEYDQLVLEILKTSLKV
ncbi:D-alanine--D-alanine ligase [Thiotrichales bacterium 19S3-7]|nr:D-alanine--D-alanine ligase [Thiotrichales bacterium 19S3-7]MCF6802889.1 D-alanine--D-alanine ligase [Thiotrichales bacterium 19S3-11]